MKIKKIASVVIVFTILLNGCDILSNKEIDVNKGIPGKEYVTDNTDIKNDEEDDFVANNVEDYDTDEEPEAVDNDGLYYTKPPISIEEIKKNIKIETEVCDDVMAVIITNNNEFVIPDLDVTVVFYKDGSMIDSDKDGHDALYPGNPVASNIEVPENADDFEVIIDVDWVYGEPYRNYVENVKVESNIGNDNVMIKFTNTGETDIDELEYIVLFYKNGKFVGTSGCEDVMGFFAGTTIIEKAENWYHSLKDFDDYRILINQAHNFNISW